MLDNYVKRLEEEIKSKNKLIKRLGNMLNDKEERIDKVIKYIETYKEQFKNYNLSDVEFNAIYLLEILKGSSDNG